MLIPLKIDKKLKWGLSFLMGLGVFAGVAAIVRSWAAKFVVSEDSSYGVGTLFLWGEIEEWIVLIAMSVPPVWPLFRPWVQGLVKTATSESRSRRYKQEYPYGSSAGGGSAVPPKVTTTVSITSSTRGGTPLPSPRLQVSKYGEILEETVDDERDVESRTVIAHEGDDPSKESRRKSVSANIRNSIKLQDGWMELYDLREQDHK
ncbi:hypothetical protein PHISCL_00667 [Aspergillus sclerotialis]|uniref:Rhodopsin domain-containing protein n=1 Tax=Aspergillus sclerotialis TaxID=2070753 RepID=A0A3A2ZV81_9EURO|nr:hypothetical protein PHISCL_00667 [Aspergillus sclerotialis]